MRHAILMVLGVVLIVLGFAGYHVEIGAIIVGALFVGLTSVDKLAPMIVARTAGRAARSDGGSEP